MGDVLMELGLDEQFNSEPPLHTHANIDIECHDPAKIFSINLWTTTMHSSSILHSFVCESYHTVFKARVRVI